MSCDVVSGGGFAADILRALFVALVIVAMVMDVRTRRIPNWLNAALLVGGIAAALLTHPPLDALRISLGGMLVGLGIWIVFYAMGVMGAGDVKFYAAASAWLGAGLAWRGALVAGLAGGVLSLVFLMRDGRLGSTLRRLSLLPLTRTLPTPEVVVAAPVEAKRQLPYGVALGLGAMFALLFPSSLCGL